MTTAYNSYKAKQTKVKEPRQKKDPNDAVALTDTINKITDKLTNLDKTAWRAENAALFQAALLTLRVEIENLMTPTVTE